MTKRSFTLIELLVALALGGLMASIILVSLGSVRERARITKALHFSGQIQHALGADVVGLWDFNEITPDGKVLDRSGYNNHGTVNGAVLTNSLSELGMALSFDGVDDYVQIPAGQSLALQSFTVSVWFKVTDVITDLYYGSLTARGNFGLGYRDNYHLYILKNTYTLGARVGFDTSAFSLGHNYNYNDDKWHNAILSAEYSNGTTVLKLYSDGVLRNTGTFNAAPHTDPTYSNRIGRWAAQYFPGLIDEVRIYNQALTSAQIQKHYAEGLERHKNLVIE